MLFFTSLFHLMGRHVKTKFGINPESAVVDFKALSHYNVLGKVSLTFFKRRAFWSAKRRRTLEVGGEALDDRCMSLVVVGGRQKKQWVAGSFWHGKKSATFFCKRSLAFTHHSLPLFCRPQRSSTVQAEEGHQERWKNDRRTGTVYMDAIRSIRSTFCSEINFHGRS